MPPASTPKPSTARRGRELLESGRESPDWCLLRGIPASAARAAGIGCSRGGGDIIAVVESVEGEDCGQARVILEEATCTAELLSAGRLACCAHTSAAMRLIMATKINAE
jgi:hypothetical protein